MSWVWLSSWPRWGPLVTSRADVDLLLNASRGIVKLATAELNRFYRSLTVTDPVLVRDALAMFVPELVVKYGDYAATVAADWYERVRRDAVGGAYNARTVGPVPAAQVDGSVRWAAGKLFEHEDPIYEDVIDESGYVATRQIGTRLIAADPDGMLALLAGSVQRYVFQSSRGTIARNVQLDPSKPRFGRVPTGAKTCAWCTLLASRGFVYHSRETAGISDHFHDDCDCQIVSQWDDAAAIDGYDPDELYGMYMTARQELEGAGNLAPRDDEIAARMRRLFPESFTDGVFDN